jgi:hypothetical protein
MTQAIFLTHFADLVTRLETTTFQQHILPVQSDLLEVFIDGN